jgi:hypothetical protein
MSGSHGERVAQPIVEGNDVVLAGNEDTAIAVDTRIHCELAPFGGCKILAVDPVKQFD